MAYSLSYLMLIILYSDKTIKFNVSCSSDILTYTLIEGSEWLAVTDFNKELTILNSKTGEIISTRKVQKKITQLTAIKPPEEYKPYYKEFPSLILLAADKVGEILAYPLPNIDKQENMILGHCASIITSFSFSLDNHFILTADRDEKIRISNYPKATIISSYCLNHTKYVFCLTVITNNLMVSGGGDGKLCLWNIPEGNLLREYQFNEFIGLEKSISLNSIYYDKNKKFHNVLYIFNINEDTCELNLINKISYESSIISLSFTTDDIVFCSTKGGEYIYMNSISTGERIENELIKSIRENLKEYYDVLTNYNNDTQFHSELEKEQLKVRFDPIALKGQTTTLTPYPESK